MNVCWKTKWIPVVLLWAWMLTAGAQLKVASLHPLLSDLARQVGGDRIELAEIVKPGTDPHHFSPSTQDMQLLSGAKLVLASGKGLENYLGKLQQNLNPGQTLLEVGRSIPSMEMAESSRLMEPGAGIGEGHVHGAVDPHWWNSLENMIRACRTVEAAFSEADPAGNSGYAARASAYQKKLTDLRRWARQEIGKIPAPERKLATAHLSLGYFAKEFGFRLIPVQGMNPEVQATSRDLAAAVATIRKSGVKAIFPEQGVNPKHLEKIADETGIKFGGQLIADGNGTGALSTFAGAFEHNVRQIVLALAPAPTP